MRRIWTVVLGLWPMVAVAQEAPRVVVDIAPVHALTAQVMQSVGTPALLLPPGADPHDYALRPSDARGLDGADLVIWVGEALTPQLADPIATLAGDAALLELMEAPGWTPRPFEEDADEDHGGDDHDHDHDHGHHGEADPHAWLDPQVAQAWARAIAVALSEADPENASRYAANAAALIEELDALDAEIAAGFDGVAPRYIAPHDAMGYFAARYGVPAVGQLAASDAQAPGPARLQGLSDLARSGKVACVLHRPGASQYASLVAEGSGARVAPLDVTGETLQPGPALYGALLRQIAETLRDCG